MNYSGIGVFRHTFDNQNKITKFEERVVLIEAATYEEAETLMLEDCEEYAQEDGVSFLGEFEISEISGRADKPVIEVARSIKVFTGTDEEYLQRFWDDQQPLSCDDNGWTHVWFKQADNLSACYNCQEEREGELWEDD